MATGCGAPTGWSEAGSTSWIMIWAVLDAFAMLKTKDPSDVLIEGMLNPSHDRKSAATMRIVFMLARDHLDVQISTSRDGPPTQSVWSIAVWRRGENTNEDPESFENTHGSTRDWLREAQRNFHLQIWL